MRTYWTSSGWVNSDGTPAAPRPRRPIVISTVR